MKTAIYHNPRCSKSRAALDLLRNRGIEPEIIEYLNHPPDKQSLQRLLALLGMEPRELMRKQETAYREAGLDDPSLDREQLIDAMVEHAILIERPIVVANGKAVIGRPPEKVLEIL
ncbi:MAG: arsenate reductase (glutaredoxin) [Gammaproteobacteria bacterium]